MPLRQRKIGIVLVGVVLTVLAMTADASIEPDLDSAWRSYMTNQSTNEPAMQFPYATCFSVAALEHGLPETLLLAVARGESDFESTARSRANAHGVMQILWPGTAKHLGINRLSELYDPCTNIDAGTRYLKEMLARYDGNVHLALAAYNYGPQRIAKSGEDIPNGATWYSGYIFRHLGYVLGNATGNRQMASAVATSSHSLYSEIGQSTLLTFGEPYRATAFIARLESAAPDLSLDWFRRGTGEFEVVMTYADKDGFERSARLLERAGYRLN